MRALNICLIVIALVGVVTSRGLVPLSETEEQNGLSEFLNEELEEGDQYSANDIEELENSDLELIDVTSTKYFETTSARPPQPSSSLRPPHSTPSKPSSSPRPPAPPTSENPSTGSRPPHPKPTKPSSSQKPPRPEPEGPGNDSKPSHPVPSKPHSDPKPPRPAMDPKLPRPAPPRPARAQLILTLE